MKEVGGLLEINETPEVTDKELRKLEKVYKGLNQQNRPLLISTASLMLTAQKNAEPEK